MKRVLIVSLRAGAGHIKAAEAIEMGLRKQHPEIKIENIDFLDYADFLSQRFYGEWYLDLVRAVPALYGWLYKNIKPSSTDYRLIFDRINAREFKEKVFDFNPDLIICTHFVPANLLTYWRDKYHGLHAQIYLIVTDFEAHSLWADAKVDRYFVANEQVKKQLLRYKIAQSKIKVTGIPIDEKFLKKFDKKEIRKRLGLEDKFTVAIFSGGFGIGPVAETLKKILKMSEDFQVIIVAGKNAELYHTLTEIVRDGKRKVLLYRFVTNIEELMAISDVIVSKPGGLTVAESLAMNIPLIISSPIPGQEEANARFLIKNRVALRADSAKKVVDTLRKMMKNRKVLEKLKKQIKKIAKPKATADIIKSLKC